MVLTSIAKQEIKGFYTLSIPYFGQTLLSENTAMDEYETAVFSFEMSVWNILYSFKAEIYKHIYFACLLYLRYSYYVLCFVLLLFLPKYKHCYMTFTGIFFGKL